MREAVRLAAAFAPGLAAVAAAAFAPGSPLGAGEAAPAVAAEEELALFEDAAFRRGFLLAFPSTARGRAVEAVLDAGDRAVRPVWRLCQWATRESLAGAPPVRLLDGGLSWENETKRVAIGGRGSGRPDLVLEVRGGAEYRGRIRRAPEAWPHLLVEQDAARIVPLDRLARLDLRATVRLAAFRDHLGGRADPSLHAAQFQLFFIVKEVAPGAGGDYLWFGVPFFDSRHEYPPPHRALDGGKDDATGKFIYTLDGRDVLPEPVRPGRWIEVRADLRPAIAAALACAVERGYLKSGEPARYAVANMNLGWEIPGAYDASMEIRGFSVVAVRRLGPEERPPAGRRRIRL